MSPTFIPSLCPTFIPSWSTSICSSHCCFLSCVLPLLLPCHSYFSSLYLLCVLLLFLSCVLLPLLPCHSSSPSFHSCPTFVPTLSFLQCVLPSMCPSLYYSILSFLDFILPPFLALSPPFSFFFLLPVLYVLFPCVLLSKPGNSLILMFLFLKDWKLLDLESRQLWFFIKKPFHHYKYQKCDSRSLVNVVFPSTGGH